MIPRNTSFHKIQESPAGKHEIFLRESRGMIIIGSGSRGRNARQSPGGFSFAAYESDLSFRVRRDKSGVAPSE